ANAVRRANVAEADIALALERVLFLADGDVTAAVRGDESAVGALVGEDAFAIAQFDGAMTARSTRVVDDEVITRVAPKGERGDVAAHQNLLLAVTQDDP